ncbi:MAG TPA: UDP-N-acetylmuramoyl-L-alanyl-D-glutamate--2,6-diaminopimelate ligase [Candidatus Levybacteria bacterium]|nr:UDP-N-acetylmuramoyl-L-alanyl-D-glutamate--2,6-diaminopimelate ligase [Candidatus Levybacteria bacterium]
MIRSLKNFAHLLLAICANVVYGFPSRSMKMVGVTGTDGKTTTASLIYDILQKSGKKVALLTTVSATIDGKSYDTGFHVTTPNSFALQKYIALAKKASVHYFILETTSHGLDQNRVFGVHYAVSVVTNIAHEHLDYHKTYEKYVAAKAKIIGVSDICIVNHDDISYPFLSQNSKLATYGLHKDAGVTLEKYPLKISMPGLFNTYNALAALAVTMQLGVSYDIAKKTIETYQTPKGRQDIVQKNPYTVMIDFAHTPNSFQALLSSLRVEYSGRIIHVFGSAGQRDHSKRASMGEISSQYSDIIVLTAEDPRNEKVEEINKEIRKGISDEFEVRSLESKGTQSKSLYQISDRKVAIEFALSLAQKGDVVVITGKGHEQTMNLGEGEFEWSDHEVVKKALEKKHDKK